MIVAAAPSVSAFTGASADTPIIQCPQGPAYASCVSAVCTIDHTTGSANAYSTGHGSMIGVGVGNPDLSQPGEPKFGPYYGVFYDPTGNCW